MRTLYDIIETTRDGEKPSYDELYHALLVMTGLLNMTMSDLRGPRVRSFFEMKVREAHHRYQQALNADPQVYLGDDVPGNPAYDRFRAMGKRLVDAALAGELPTQQGDNQ